jgi:two-component system nitrogen regulation response regulator NtrX
VVDDEPDVLDMLRERLERPRYEASTAASVEQAIVAVARVQPHLVLLGLVMPGRSGLEALTDFRQHHRTVPVIVVTRRVEPEIAHQARAGGASGIVGKSVDLDALMGLVEQAMGPTPPPPRT